MARFLILIVLCFSSVAAKTQNQENVLNDHLKEIVFAQMLNDLEVEYPIFMYTPYFFAVSSVQYIDNKMFFQETSPDMDELIDNSKLNMQQLFNDLNIEFIPPISSDTSLQMVANYKAKKILYTIKATKKGNEENFEISLPDNSYKKQANYINGQLKTLTIVKPSNTYLFSVEKVDDNTIKKTIYHTHTKKYSISEDYFINNILQKKVYYKRSKSRNSKKIKREEVFDYNTLGSVKSEIARNKKGKILDSIQYLHNSSSQLISITRHKPKEISNINYIYLDNKISSINFRNLLNNITINYSYSNNKVVQIQINNNNHISSYYFEYNKDSSLISIKKYITQKETNYVSFRNQYIFNYTDNRMLKSILETDEKGNILKEIDYEINYL